MLIRPLPAVEQHVRSVVAVCLAAVIAVVLRVAGTSEKASRPQEN